MLTFLPKARCISNSNRESIPSSSEFRRYFGMVTNRIFWHRLYRPDKYNVAATFKEWLCRNFSINCWSNDYIFGTTGKRYAMQPTVGKLRRCDYDSFFCRVLHMSRVISAALSVYGAGVTTISGRIRLAYDDKQRRIAFLRNVIVSQHQWFESTMRY